MIGVTVVAEGNWPSFRGEQAAGVGDGPDLPEIMDGESGKGLLYKVRCSRSGPFQSHRVARSFVPDHGGQ